MFVETLYPWVRSRSYTVFLITNNYFLLHHAAITGNDVSSAEEIARNNIGVTFQEEVNVSLNRLIIFNRIPSYKSRCTVYINIAKYIPGTNHD